MYFKRRKVNISLMLRQRIFYNSSEKVKNPLSALDFSKIIQEVNKNCIYKLALTGEEFRMPYGLGVLYVAKRKIHLKLNEDGSLYLKNQIR